MRSLSSKIENVKYFLCVIDIFTKYAWVKPLKDKKGKIVLNAYIKIVNESNSKTNKSWVNQVREFYNKLIQEWLDDNDILMYMTYNEGKSVISERFMKTLRDKIYKKMTANDRKSYPSYLNKIEDQCNNTYHSSVGKKLLMLIILLWLKKLRQILKLLNLKLMIVRVTTSKNIFSNGYTENLSREIFIIDSLLKTNP